MGTETTRTVTAPDGHPLHVDEIRSGDGVPLLVLPGGPCRGAEYLGDLAGVGADRPVVVLHPRGTPTTGGLSRGWWWDADDALAVIDALGAEQVDVLAHSAGARLALALAARYPASVRSLVLVTPASGWLTGTEHDGADIVARRADPGLEAVWQALHGPDPEDEAAFAAGRAAHARAGYSAWSEAEQAHARLGAQSLAAVRAWNQDVPDDVASRVVAAPLPPALVISGSDDVLVGVRPVEQLADTLGAALVMLDGCGHYPWVEQPAAFRDAVDRWLGLWDEA